MEGKFVTLALYRTGELLVLDMRRAFSVAGLALALLLLATSAAAAQPVRGYATYSLSVRSPLGEHSVVLNETVGASSKAGYSDLVLQLFGGAQNLTYSKLVNASVNLFPYLPSLAGQSFSYSNGTAYGIHANITTASSATVMFDGSQYTMRVYVVSVTAFMGTKSMETNATVEAFPSTLVYSASAGNSTVGLQALLLATDLPLTASSPQMAPAVYVGTGLGIGAVAVGGALMIRRRDKKAEKQGEKPLHWVD